MLKEYLVKKVGTEKSYLFMKMQFAIILSIVIAVLYSFFKELLILQVLPAAILLLSFNELYKKYTKDFWASFVIFSVLFIVIIATPFYLQTIAIRAGEPLMLLKYLIYLAFALVILLLLSRIFSIKKEVYGRVVLADNKTAVLEVDFDLLSGIKAGKYVVENNGAKKGDWARASVKRGLFKGPHLHKIIKKK